MKFVETLKIKDGVVDNLPLHRARFARTGARFFKNPPPFPDLAPHIPAPRGVFKARIVYGEAVEKIEVLPYVPRVIRSLRVVESEPFDYAHKSLDRARLDSLYLRRGEADDILIAVNGCVCDTSYTNVVFADARGRLFTPDTCLLNGTRRQKLLADGRIVERAIRVADIPTFAEVLLINALLDLPDALRVPTGAVC